MTSDPATPRLENQSLDKSWKTIDRLDWQLWALVLVLILVLGGGLLSMMFPTAFLMREGLVLRAPERVFYGLSVMLGLTLAYLAQRQATLRRIKRGLVTERQRWEDELAHNAFYDALTDLPNRNLLVDRLNKALSRTKRRKEVQFAVVLFDLDRFKWINDSMGHVFVDNVLKETARRLQRCLRAEDSAARLGGDEFAILLENTKNMGEIVHAVERIQKELSLPISLEGREVFTSASMGISLSSMGYEAAEDLLRDADTAMYRAKAQGTGQYAVFDAKMHEYAVSLLNLETELRRACERQEFVLHYQPIVWLHTGQVAGLEALVRWIHPERGCIPPGEFIPAAEASGLIIPMTRMLVQKVCQQAREWQEKCPESWPLSLSMHVPARYLTKE